MAEADEQKNKALADFREKLLRHKEVEGKVKTLRQSVKELKKEFDKTESDLQALQSVGQIIGEVLRQLDDERLGKEEGANLLGSPELVLFLHDDTKPHPTTMQSSSRPAADLGMSWAAGAGWTSPS
eukprot:1158731-Pelagomonas_calceolata.AAC.6